MDRFLSIIIALFLGLNLLAQETTTLSPQEQEIVNISNDKWLWMSEKNIEKLSNLFHDSAQFVHMGRYWGKEAELNTIREGGIWHKRLKFTSKRLNSQDRQ